MISVIVPVRDGGEKLGRCLDAIARQRVPEPVEVVVVDSGSSDGSRERARSAGARVFTVAPDEFRHGATRNLAAESARGDLLVFTSQDALALSDDWLERLATSLRADEGLAGTYGRQVPHRDASAPERFFLEYVYGPHPRVQRVHDAAELSLHVTLFSNVNSAIPRTVWQSFPFADDVAFGEDQDWARRVLVAGYGIRYEPEAVVRHSHSYTLTGAFKRFFDTGVLGERAFLAGGSTSAAVLRREALRYARAEVRWLISTGQHRSIPYATAYELAKFLGLQAGAHHRLLPLWVKRQFSLFPGYWDEHGRRMDPPSMGQGHRACAQKTKATSESRSDFE
jgi:rhamnosyltransferase